MNRIVGAGLAVSLIALVVYLRTLCPTIFVGDAGELAWAAASLGIAHPPGYPIWTLLGRIFVLASPSAPAVALNVMSAVAAAATAGLVAALLGMLTGRILVSAAVALAFAWSRSFWPVAVVTEVYALNLLVTVGALASAFAARHGRPRLFLLAAYLLGLGTANHPFVLLAGLPVAGLALAPGPSEESTATRLRRLLPMAGLFLLGISAYLYLPLRWSAGPEMNWGGMRSLADVWDHVLRAQYGGLGEASADTTYGLRLRVFFQVLARGVPGLLALAAAGGLVHLVRAGHAMRAGVLGLFFVLAGPVTAAVIRYEDSFLDESVVTVFFLPAVLAVFLLAGVGVAALDRWASRRLAGSGRLATVVTVAITVLVPGIAYQTNVRACDRGESTIAKVYAEAMLDPLPPNARLYVLGDNATFALAYFQKVEGLRPDVVLADRTLNLFVESYGEDFLALSRPERKRRRDEREVEIAFDSPGVPIFYSEIFDLADFGGSRLVPWGIVHQLLRPGELAASYRHKLIDLPPVDPDDFLETHLAGVTLYRQGLGLMREGRNDEARHSFLAAADPGQRIAGLLRNLGLAHLDLGDLTTAEERFLQALALEPANADALYNLAVLYTLSGRVPESLTYFEKLVAAGSEFPEVYLNYGIQLVRAGRLADAGAAAAAALAIDPDIEAARLLQEAVRRGLEIGGQEGILEATRLVDPVATGGTLQLAQRYVERGEIEKATELYREAAQRDPDSIEAAYGLGYGLLKAGLYEEAANAFRRILVLDPENADGRNALAYLFSLTGDSLSHAENLAEEALELDPALSAYWYDTLGWVRYRAGKHERALEALRRSEELLPPDDPSMRAENHYHIGAVLMALGKNEEAADYLTKSTRRAKDEFWVADLKARVRELGIEEGTI